MQGRGSDFGTILFHWLIVFGLLGAAVTGLAIACADNPDFWVVYYLGFLLPGENIWFYHLAFGIGLFASLVAYIVYVKRAKLQSRTALDSVRFTALFMGKNFFSTLNILLYWLLFLTFGFAIVSGVILYLGWGEPLRLLHLQSTWILLGFLFAHPLVHWLYGGADQLLRIFRPRWRLAQEAPIVDALIERLQQLETEKRLPAEASAEEAHLSHPNKQKPAGILVPIALAVLAGTAAVYFSLVAGEQTHQTLKIVKISAEEAPIIDGELSERAWRRAPVVTVLTQHGANLDKGESNVEVRAIHDGTYAYFSFTWSDPTRSLMHMPLVKQEDGWHLMRSNRPGNETGINEDKFAVLLTAGGQPLIGNGIHLGRRPSPAKLEGATGRGLHFIEGGSGEIWLWRASHGGMLGWIDHGHFGPPLPADAASTAGRYPGGFSLDGGQRPYRDNFTILSKDDAYPLVRPLRFPSSAAGILRLASHNLDPENGDSKSARSWLTPSESIDYAEEVDRLIPAGAVIPSVILKPEDMKHEDFTGLASAARWASGRWSLEVRRRLDTGNPKDATIKTGTLMWVAAFDHAETWHTYHIRPLELEVEER
ncbi:MAG: ethylbenzene dehydrogenase-related protein [Rhodomicrobium sp.]